VLSGDGANGLRRGSYNSALLKTAAPLMDAGAELEIASLYGIPVVSQLFP
jgi:NAD(P)H-dependent FMN reductase